jgi:hypothetical protein
MSTLANAESIRTALTTLQEKQNRYRQIELGIAILQSERMEVDVELVKLREQLVDVGVQGLYRIEYDCPAGPVTEHVCTLRDIPSEHDLILAGLYTLGMRIRHSVGDDLFIAPHRDGPVPAYHHFDVDTILQVCPPGHGRGVLDRLKKACASAREYAKANPTFHLTPLIGANSTTLVFHEEKIFQWARYLFDNASRAFFPDEKDDAFYSTFSAEAGAAVGYLTDKSFTFVWGDWDTNKVDRALGDFRVALKAHQQERARVVAVEENRDRDRK